MAIVPSSSPESPEGGLRKVLRHLRRSVLAVLRAAALELVREAPAIMIGGLGMTATWFLAVHSQARGGHLQSEYSWAPWLFIGVIVLGALLWVVRVLRRVRENPKNITISDVHRGVEELRQLMVQHGSTPPQLAGSTVVVPPGGKVGVAVGVGPLVVDLPPGGTMQFPDGGTIRTAHDEARTDDHVSR